jgi:hypothetical protein
MIRLGIRCEHFLAHSTLADNTKSPPAVALIVCSFPVLLPLRTNSRESLNQRVDEPPRHLKTKGKVRYPLPMGENPDLAWAAPPNQEALEARRSGGLYGYDADWRDR